MSYKLRSLKGCRCTGMPELGQQQPDTAFSALGTSVVSTAGWLELSRIFRINYAAELSFVHPHTLIHPYVLTANHPSPASDARQPFEHHAALPPNSSGMILAFLALTLRHCCDELQGYLVPGVHDLTDGAALSARFASLASHWLVAHDSGRLCSRVEGLEVRLMLAMYECSLGRCARSRHLLSEAISVAIDLGILQGYHVDSSGSEISIAMAFEAESMGVGTESISKEKSRLAHEVNEEVARQISWSCYLMDAQGSLGKRRSKIIHKTAQLTSLLESETTFTVDANGGRKLSSSYSHPQTGPASGHPTYARTSCGSAPVPPDRMSIDDDDCSGKSAGKILIYYLHFLSLLHRIQNWTDSEPWK